MSQPYTNWDQWRISLCYQRDSGPRFEQRIFRMLAFQTLLCVSVFCECSRIALSRRTMKRPALSPTLWTTDVLQIAGMADPASYLYGLLIEGIRPNRYTCKQKWPFRPRSLEVLALCRVSFLERRPNSFGRRNYSLRCRKNWSQKLQISLPSRSIHSSPAGRVFIKNCYFCYNSVSYIL
jgi:hypothetical protein